MNLDEITEKGLLEFCINAPIGLIDGALKEFEPEPTEETIYRSFELKEGKCTSCSEDSTEILKGDGRCVDCIEEQKFYNETMKGV